MELDRHSLGVWERVSDDVGAFPVENVSGFGGYWIGANCNNMIALLCLFVNY